MKKVNDKKDDRGNTTTATVVHPDDVSSEEKEEALQYCYKLIFKRNGDDSPEGETSTISGESPS